MTGRLSEKSLAKARRLVDEGHVREVTNSRLFQVQGDHGTYTVTVTAPGEAACTCPVYGACSHQAAALSVATLGAAPTEQPDQTAGPPPRLYTWSFRAALAAQPEGCRPRQDQPR